MAASQILDDVLRKQIKSTLRQEFLEINQYGSIINQYMIEASFLPYFTNTLLKPLIWESAYETVELVILGEIVDDLVYSEADKMGELAIEEAYLQEKQREEKLVFKKDMEKNIIDMAIFEVVL